jgi:hypothetical protein
MDAGMVDRIRAILVNEEWLKTLFLSPVYTPKPASSEFELQFLSPVRSVCAAEWLIKSRIGPRAPEFRLFE